LKTDWLERKMPELRDRNFVLSIQERGKMVICAASKHATEKGITPGMGIAHCRAIFPDIKVLEDQMTDANRILTDIGTWMIKYSPVVAAYQPDCIILNASGCTHLWGGEQQYVHSIMAGIQQYGYTIQCGMADTIGAAWAVAHCAATTIVPVGETVSALIPLPVMALRLTDALSLKLQKLGLQQIGSFMSMPRNALRRRFGEQLILRLDQALGQTPETIAPLCPPTPYSVRLPCTEPVKTAVGIEQAMNAMLTELCARMEQEEVGLRQCMLKCYRIDGTMQKTGIGTSRASRNVAHLLGLLVHKIVEIAPEWGIELFILEAPVTEKLTAEQESLWVISNYNDQQVSELIDRITGKVGQNVVRRYLPADRYWPERACIISSSLNQKTEIKWRKHVPRPLYLLPRPEKIEVTVPLPDYPPLLFVYKGNLHHVKKADGPERIEQEWWIQGGLQRDYYCVEDEYGGRFWLFRLGHYNSDEVQWYLHGFFH
jgi:protein ImuB